MKTIKLAYVVSHPIQYQAPLLRLIAQQPGIDLTVFFCSKISLNQFTDPEFKQTITWDVPLLEGYKHEFLPALGRDDGLSFLRPFVYGLKRRLKRGKFDAVWVHGWGRWTHIWAIIAGHHLGLTVLLRGEAGTHLEPATGLKKWIKHVFIAWLLRHVDRFLVIGTYNRQFYLSHGVAPQKLHVVPYAVDNAFFRKRAQEAASTREQLRTALGLAPDRPIILYASKLTTRKRADDLLDAYILLSPDGQREPHPYLLVVGEGELSASLQQRTRHVGWSSIKFLGFKNQTELPQYYDLCDAFVLPSLNEPWGLVVNEAMNAGKPLVVSDQVGCAPDLVQHGVNGFVFKAGDVPALADALRRLALDPSLRKKMGEESLRIVEALGLASNIVGLRAALQLDS